MNLPISTDTTAAMRVLSDAHIALREQRTTKAYEDAIRWIDALIVMQQAHMMSCARDKLADAQIRVKTLRALRSALADPGGAMTGHCFD